MKTCGRCGESKSIDQFSKSRRAKDGLQYMCKPCANAAGLANYQENKDRYFAHAKVRDRKLDKLIFDRKNVPCTDCGVKYPHYIMDFDHLPEFEKVENISHMRRRRRAFDKIVAEMDKCEVVCANCHRFRSFSRNPHRFGEGDA